MPGVEVLLLLAAALLVGVNAVFVGAEFSLLTVDRPSVRRDAAAGQRSARSLDAALSSLSTQLSGAQLGITVSSLAVGFLAEPSLAELLRGPLGAVGLPGAAVDGVAVAVALVLATAVQMVLGELVPKNWAIAQPRQVARVVVGPQRLFTRLARPLLAVLNGSANAVLRLFGLEPQEELASARAPRELVSLVRRSEDVGTLDHDAARLVARSLEFGERIAADAMTPRPRVRFVDADAPAGEVLRLAREHGLARFPVTGPGGVDDVVGVAHFKQVLAVARAERETRRVRDVMTPAAAVPTTMELDPLLVQLRRPGLQMAVVVDEFGGTAGVVTLEDLVEEIVGEIADEHDRQARLVRDGPDGVDVDATARPDELTRLLGLRLPEGRTTETVAGLVNERLGRLARPGDRVPLRATDERDLDEDGLPREVDVEVEVREVSGWRVRVLRLHREPSRTGAARAGRPGSSSVVA